MPATTPVLDLIEDIRCLLNRAASGQRLSFYERELLGLKIVCLRHELARIPKGPSFPPDPECPAPIHYPSPLAGHEQPNRQD